MRLVESGLSPQRLELEIAEAALLDNQAAHLSTIRQLKNLGVSIVLDNCGTGHSSASYLTDFPFDKIKIDKSFAQGFASRRECAAVVSSVLALAHGLDIATTAKGMESSEQFEALQAAGVDSCKAICSDGRFRIPNSTSMRPFADKTSPEVGRNPCKYPPTLLSIESADSI